MSRISTAFRPRISCSSSIFHCDGEPGQSLAGASPKRTTRHRLVNGANVELLSVQFQSSLQSSDLIRAIKIFYGSFRADVGVSSGSTKGKARETCGVEISSNLFLQFSHTWRSSGLISSTECLPLFCTLSFSICVFLKEARKPLAPSTPSFSRQLVWFVRFRKNNSTGPPDVPKFKLDSTICPVWLRRRILPVFGKHRWHHGSLPTRDHLLRLRPIFAAPLDDTKSLLGCLPDLSLREDCMAFLWKYLDLEQPEPGNSASLDSMLAFHLLSLRWLLSLRLQKQQRNTQ